MAEAVACRAALYGFNSHPQLFGVACNAFPPVSVLKGSKTIKNMTTTTRTSHVIHDYERILETLKFPLTL